MDKGWEVALKALRYLPERQVMSNPDDNSAPGERGQAFDEEGGETVRTSHPPSGFFTLKIVADAQAATDTRAVPDEVLLGEKTVQEGGPGRLPPPPVLVTPRPFDVPLEAGVLGAIEEDARVERFLDDTSTTPRPRDPRMPQVPQDVTVPMVSPMAHVPTLVIRTETAKSQVVAIVGGGGYWTKLAISLQNNLDRHVPGAVTVTPASEQCRDERDSITVFVHDLGLCQGLRNDRYVFPVDIRRDALLVIGELCRKLEEISMGSSRFLQLRVTRMHSGDLQFRWGTTETMGVVVAAMVTENNPGFWGWLKRFFRNRR